MIAPWAGAMIGRPDLALLRPGRDSRLLPRPSALAPESVAAASASADALSDVLRTVRLTGALFFLVDASAPWTHRAA